MKKLTRKEFLESLMTAATGAAGAALLVACGSSNNSPDAAPGNCLADGTNVQIAGNHGHVLVVSKADIMAGAAINYDITGTATHTHHVTISAANFTSLTGNMNVTTVSTTDSNHSHNITVICV
jgi:hypothetical protein